MQGEHPHGTFHLHHAGWRLNWPLISVCADHLNNKQAVADPTVSDFNRTLYFRLLLTRACSEYVNEISAANGPTTDLAAEFVRACEANIDLAWIVHFLYDDSFMVLQWKEFVRSNNSAGLDLLWREYLALAKTATAHKTNYAPMAVLRVFWGQALVRPLNDLYHRVRTIPMGDAPGTNVGWDMPCENLHRAITASVRVLVSEARISRFIDEWPFLERVANGLRQLMYRLRNRREPRMKEMDTDVQKLKSLFRAKVGRDWATASAQNDRPKLIGSGWRGRPWVEMQAAMTQQGRESVHEWIVRHLQTNVPFFSWCP